MPYLHSPDPRTERSLRRSVRDGTAYAVMAGAGEAYFSAYALFLKAGTAHISALAALPALLGSASQLLAAWLGRYVARRKTLILGGVLLQLIAWLPIIWLPYLLPQAALPALLGGVALYYLGGNLAAPMWNSLMGDLVPERRRGRFFGRRTRLMSIASFAAMLGAGVLLHYCELAERTRLGFMLIFTVAAAARGYSLVQLARMHEPPGRHAGLALPALHDLVPRLRRSPFARFSLFFAAFNFTVAIASPFFAVYMLRDLGFSYLEFTLSTAASVLMQFATLRLWGRLGDAFGNRLVLVVTGTLIPALPALWLVSTSFWYILALQAAGGLAWAGFSLAAGNYLYDTVAPEKRAGYAAVHQMLSNAGVFAGALLGGLLAAWLPAGLSLFGHTWHWASSLWGLMLVSTAGRALLAALFLPRLDEVRRVRRLTPAGLLARVLGLRWLLSGPWRRTPARLASG
jgi:MFS family permease